METKLKIKFEGTVPGLAAHRLSIGEFGRTLTTLVESLRRIASAVLRDAVDPEYGSRGGRIKNEAKLLDVELASIGGGSIELLLACVLHEPPRSNLNLFQDLPATVAERFVDAVNEESQSRASSYAARKFLKALPAEVTAQRYTVYRGDKLTRDVTVGQVNLIALEDDAIELPELREHTGRVTLVGFEPGEPRLAVLTRTGDTHTAFASARQVERALSLRTAEVRVLFVGTGRHSRLLWVVPLTQEPLDPTARREAMFKRWDGVLRRLAK